jgi:hypothetical protein
LSQPEYCLNFLALELLALLASSTLFHQVQALKKSNLLLPVYCQSYQVQE